MSQAAAWTGSRRLLKRLRNVMAGSGSGQERLDQVVRLIAADMVAEVCSAYVLRAGEMLELYATEGLRAEAVHKTRMRVGEGLIGDIAAHIRPLALADAWSHPKFAYKPETGEDLYRSMLGVPIMRGGRVLGVLAVQNRATRSYTEEEIETLETVAMVLAELLASGDLIAPGEAQSAETVIAPRRLDGVRLNGGLAIGHAVLHQQRVVIRHMVAEDPEAELARLQRGVADMHAQLDHLLAAEDLAAAGEHRDVLETYAMFARDRGWLGRIREAVLSGLTAEAAVQKVQNDMRTRMREVLDPYLRERLHDLEDLSARLLQILIGPGEGGRKPLPEDAILVARAMGPAELLDYDRRRLRGLVLEDGTPTAHVAIVARALDLPVVGRVKDACDRIEADDLLVVDGDGAQVLLRPGEDVLGDLRETMRLSAERHAAYAALGDLPSVTGDGAAVDLLLNCGLLIDVAHLDTTRAAGIGLYRTEIAFMVRGGYPDVVTQIDLYRRVLDQAGSRPVVFRTLDIGGDKLLPGQDAVSTENPAMGWRAIRIALDRPASLRTQLRAMLAAADGRPLGIMFPMIASLGEWRAAKAILELELSQAARPPASLQIGSMVEVPALLWQMDELLAEVDFLSIGSNDLMQFLFAADRGDPAVSDRYDPLSVPALRCLSDLAARARAAGKPITVCGEMAGRPLEALALLGLGFRRLSMGPASVGPVRAMMLATDTAAVGGVIRHWLARPEINLRGLLRAFARDNGIPV